MKVLIVHNSYLEKGGEDEAVEAEVSMLKSFGHDVQFYQVSNDIIKKYDVIKKLLFFFKGIFFSRDSYEDLEEIIKDFSPQIVHIHNTFFVISRSIYDLCVTYQIPVVQTCHNYRPLCPVGTFFVKGSLCNKCLVLNDFECVKNRCWKNSYFFSFMLFLLVRSYKKNNVYTYKISKVITPSIFSKKKFENAGYFLDKIVVKPNFTNPIQNDERKDLGYYVFIGRVTSYKGIEIVLESFKKLNQKLIIIGDGPQKQELKTKMMNHENIQFLGRIDNKEALQYLKNARALIFSSICYETFGKVVIEAFACGVPVIVSNISSASSLVEDRITGLVYKGSDSGQLIDKVQELDANEELRKTIGKNVLIEYQRKYTRDINYELLMNIYNSVIEKE